MSLWLRLLIACLVFGHGLVYARVGSMLPDAVNGWNGRSWMLGGSIVGERMTTIIIGLHLLAGLLLMASALAIVLSPLVADWWRPLAIMGSLAGIAAFALFWDGQVALLVEEGGPGALISAVILVVAWALPQTFG